jgi:hypothetical protein
LAAEADELPFDQVIVNVDGGRRELTPSELLALPLHQRVRWLLDDSLEFYRKGRRVERRHALAALRQVQVPGGT